MAGIGQAQQSLAVPSPSELAGGQMTPAVTPSAVTQMSEALRQGFLTADDIIARTGKRAQLKEKADVMALQQQMSPETLAAQDVMRRAAVTKAQGSIDVAPGEVARAQAENKMAADIAEAGVGFSDVAKNLSSQGQQIPRTPDGKIDVSAAFAESANIDRFRAAQSAAIANKPEKQTVTLASGAQQSVDWDKLTNRQMSPAEVNARYAAIGKTANYNVWKSSDLFGPQPGQVAAPQDMPPAPIIEPKAPVDTGKLRAEMINAGRLDIGAGLSDEALLEQFPQTELVTPKVAPVAAKPDVMPSTELSGVGSSVTKEAPAPSPADTTATQNQIRTSITDLPPVKDYDIVQGPVTNAHDIKTQLQPDGNYVPGKQNVGKTLDHNLIFAYMKIIDPTSVVREGEFKVASNLSPLDERLLNVNNLKNIWLGRSYLTPGTRVEILNRIDEIANSKKQSAIATLRPYEKMAQERGWDVDFVLGPQRSQLLRESATAAPSAGQSAAAPTTASPASAKPTRVPAKDAAGNVIPYVWIEQ